MEIVNNWRVDRFDETYRSPRMNAQLAHALEITRPDVLHVHNLLNLSFDLPMLARRRGIPSVATLHDYTLVCASGGQRVHVAESHVCDVIDTERCSRCFRESPFHALIAAGSVSRGPAAGVITQAGTLAARRFPRLANAAARRLPITAVSPDDLATRLSYARHVFDAIDLFVAPSEYLARESHDLARTPTESVCRDTDFQPRRQPFVSRCRGCFESVLSARLSGTRASTCSWTRSVSSWAPSS